MAKELNQYYDAHWVESQNVSQEQEGDKLADELVGYRGGNIEISDDRTLLQISGIIVTFTVGNQFLSMYLENPPVSNLTIKQALIDFENNFLQNNDTESAKIARSWLKRAGFLS